MPGRIIAGDGRRARLALHIWRDDGWPSSARWWRFSMAAALAAWEANLRREGRRGVVRFVVAPREAA